MILLSEEQLLQINGGVSASASMVNAFVRGFTLILNLGRSLGTSIRRMQDNNLC